LGVPYLSPHELREIAVVGLIDPRTIVSYLRRDRRIRSTTRMRVERALRESGRADLIHDTSQPPVSA
jgi:hypothetical protein